MAWAQKVVLNKTDGSRITYSVSELNSIDFLEAGSWLVTKITLSETSITLKPDETKTITATVLPEDADNKSVTWESSDEDVAEVNKNGRVIANAEGECTITCTAVDGSGVKAKCKVWVMPDGTYGTTNGHDWVDLGLPSGTLWATCNVGASSPEEYGNYYAWGETTTKSNYDWSTYKWCKGTYATMTKYCTESNYGYNGFTDGRTELLSADDAATANWGNSWQMPSNEQIKELISNTSLKVKQQNGVDGVLITSELNKNNIFLPYACRYVETQIYEPSGIYGSYWSRSLNSSYPDMEFPPDYAYGMYFDLGSIWWIINGDDWRCYGLSVRPVRKQ